jgi:hypothetical protein
MSNFEETPEKSLAEIIEEAVTKTNFGDGIEVVPVKNIETIAELKEAQIGLDFRAQAESDENTSSVFEGLAFDPEHLRCQSFALYTTVEGKRVPIATASIVITPKKIVGAQRYFEQTEMGIYIQDFTKVAEAVGEKPEIPNYTVSPAWTKVGSDYRGKFALAGVRVITGILEKIRALAPEGTFLEISAQGKLPIEKREEMAKFVASQPLDTLIPKEELPFDLSLFGQNTEGSNSTVKFANFLNVKKVENFADDMTLGPVFASKVA